MSLTKSAYILYLLAIDGRMYSSVNKLYRTEIAKKCHLDPAVMASPFITTIIDAVTLVIYFQIASAILPLG